ncbi:MAG: sigma 54-interacting transcriptional regulator [Candidatus Sulfotelmatobacter sp.]
MTHRFRLTHGPHVLQLLTKSAPETRSITATRDTGKLHPAPPAEDLLRRVIDTTPAFLHSSDPDGNHGFFNRRWLEYLGVTEEDLQGWGWTAFIHPEDLQGMLTTWNACRAGGEVFQYETRVRRADGQYLWFLHRNVPQWDDRGNIVTWYGSSIEIDDRKRAEEELKKAFDEIKTLKDQLHKENLALKEEIDQASMFEEIVGASDAIKRVLAILCKVAPTDSTVLITGETGTGKELAARAIHKRSRRARNAFVAVNCAAIPPSLIASELFGHEKGAFTGATQRRLGRFEVADGGTIFLDEVGDLPAETQIVLLRVLQERELERVGGTHPVPIDVRVIGATNRDLQAAVDAGSFRRDLFYRLNVFPIRMPSLHERVEDIPLLVAYLAQRYAGKMGKKIDAIDKRTLELFQTYHWPGNVRELQNVIERAVILCEGATLAVDENWLPRTSPRPAPSGVALACLADQEKEMIENALAQSQGRVSGRLGAATRLGVPPSTLESRIKSLNINKQRFRST